jgi:hypothetical protein
MFANAVIPNDEAAWIAVISKYVELAVIAGVQVCADVLPSCDIVRSFQRGPSTTLDIVVRSK